MNLTAAPSTSPPSSAPTFSAALGVWRRGVALLTAFGCAKLALLTLRIIDGGGSSLRSAWAVPAFIYQDVMVVIVIMALDASLQWALRNHQRAARFVARGLDVIVIAAVAYAAFNVTVARVFSTPLTHSMLGAAGGALADSILRYVTLGNVLAIVLVALSSLGAARRVRRLPSRRVGVVLATLLAALVATGPGAAARVDTLGMHRNAIAALVTTTWAHSHSTPTTPTRLTKLEPLGPALDLSHLAGAARGRSVIWVILESTAARYLGSYGANPDATPRLTALAERGLVFDHAYCAQPESIKGLFSMLCGMPPGPQTDAAEYTHAKLPCTSIAAVLKERGYRTALFHSGRFRYLGMQGVVDDRGFEELQDAGKIGGEFASSFGTADATTVDRALEFLDRAAGKPFFLVYSPISGHHPYRSPGRGPRPFPAKSEQDHYRNDLYAGDDALGALIDGVRQRKLDHKVLWAIVGDHGQAFGEHEGNFAHTLFLYEENVHVPMMFVAPGALTARVHAPQITSLIDLAPATLALLGLDAPKEMWGRSPLEPEPGVAHFFTDHGPLKLGLRQGKYKFLYETEHDRSRLFDLDADPAERNDLSASLPELAGRYRRHLLDWSQAAQSNIVAFRR
ncbi:MAG: sulfatase [Polyangiaceae bacterium]